MEGLLEKISEELQIDKSQWIPTNFGDVAIQQKGKVDRDNTDLTRYVQGGHMNSEDLHLRSWGELEDEYLGPAFIRRFDEGDILYGSRRTYLRKVVIAPFSGITSNTTFVIRANEKNIDKRLLPFIMISEGFTENSVRNSKGSVNPYINWKDIAKYEFLLPPKDQQAQLAKLLWAMDEVIEREKEVLGSVELKIKSTQKMLFSKVNYPRIKLNKYSTILGGYAFSSKSFINEGVPVIKIKNIVKGEILVDDDSNYITPDVLNLDKYVLSQGDILIAMTGATLGKIGVVQNKYDGAFLNQRVGKFQMKKGIDRWFMKGVLDSEYFLNELNKYIGEGAQGNISSEDVSKTLVPNLSESEMSDFGQKFESLYNSIKSLGNKISSSKSLQKSLINQIF
jgi:type I restriction enzyme S subunit